MALTGARGVTAIGGWLTTLVAFAAPVWSEPATSLVNLSPAAMTDRLPGMPAPTSLLATDADIPGQMDPDVPVLTTTATHRGPTDLRVLATEGERWRLMELGAALILRPLDTQVTLSSHLPYVATEPLLTGEALEDGHEPASVGAALQVGGFELGAQYRSSGTRLEGLVGVPSWVTDHEGHEVWVAQRLGPLRLQLADSELTDNVDRDPGLPRTMRDQTSLTAQLAVAEWPVLALTIASGDTERMALVNDAPDLDSDRGGDPGRPERQEFERVTGSVYYHGGPSWSLSASSTLARSRHAYRPDDAMAMTYHDLSVTVHPHASLTVTPALSLAQERYEAPGFGIDRSTAAITMSYAPTASPWSGWSHASYTQASASDDSTDARSMSLGVGLTYGLGRWLPGCAVSVQAGYDRYRDLAIPGSAAQAVSGFVILKLAGF